MSNTTVLLETSSGSILLELFDSECPETVKNFLQYVDEGFYDNTIFHRVIAGFMIQGGGLSVRKEDKGTHSPIQNEAHLPNVRGAIAMARTREVHSATSQFFINLVDNEFLNHTGERADQYGYCVFGKVIEGMEVVDKIAKIKTKVEGMHEAMPVELVVIEKASRFE